MNANVLNGDTRFFIIIKSPMKTVIDGVELFIRDLFDIQKFWVSRSTEISITFPIIPPPVYEGETGEEVAEGLMKLRPLKNC